MHGRVVPLRSPLGHVLAQLGLHRGIDAQHDLLAREGVRRGVGEAVDAHDLELARLDAARPLGE